MAKGPFAGSGNQASDIEAAQVDQGGAPSQGAAIAKGVENLANIIIPAVRENRTKELQNEVTQQAGDVKKFLKLARNPELLTSEFGVESVENPAVRQALADFVKIRDSREQGILPGRFALERLEVIMNDAIADAPAFAKEIRMAMVAATGQDPAKTLFSKLLQEPKSAGPTGAEQAEVIIQKKMRLTGLPRENIIATARAAEDNQRAQDKFEMDKRNGVANLNSLAQTATLVAGQTYGNLLEAIAIEKNTNGGIRPDFANNVVTQARLFSINARVNLIKGMEGNFDPEELEKRMAPIVQFEQDINFIVENNLLETLISDRNSLKAATIEGTVMNDAEDATALVIGGKEGFLAFKRFLNEKDNPMMAGLQQALFDDAANAASLRKAAAGGLSQPANAFNFGMPSKQVLLHQYNTMGDGKFDELTPQEKTARRMAANVVLRTPGTDTKQVTAAVDTLRGDFGWRAIGNRSVVATALAHPIVAARVVSLQTQQTGALAFDYTHSIAPLEGFSTKNLEIIGGLLVYKKGVLSRAADKSEADFEVPAWVARVNRSINTSKMYARVGILNETKFTTPEAYLRTLQTAVEKQQNEPTPEPKVDALPEFIRDADGNIVLKRG